MIKHSHSAEFTRLWSEWLKTDDGKGYEAGWGDFANRWHAERGRAWVFARMVEARDERIKGLETVLAVRAANRVKEGAAP